MCGIVGIVGKYPVNQALYDGLTVLQHRGQDAAGIVTVDNKTLRLRKANGLVKDVFEARHMQRLSGNMGISVIQQRVPPVRPKLSLFIPIALLV
jgi:amidophosphoribosyltransferase